MESDGPIKTLYLEQQLRQKPSIWTSSFVTSQRFLDPLTHLVRFGSVKTRSSVYCQFGRFPLSLRSVPDLASAERIPRKPPMLRQATGLLARLPIVSAGFRRFSSDPAAAQTAESVFIDAWKKVVPGVDPPKTSLSFMQTRPPDPSSVPSTLTVNVVLPYSLELTAKEERELMVRTQIHSLVYEFKSRKV